MFDLIGDIHGHADKLKALLEKLGYQKVRGVYKHTERKVLFIGDYIDCGPNIRETLSIVRSMVENDSAIALMGNHEYNAICFHFEKSSGGHLRKHSINNILQHYKTLKEFHGYEQEYKEYLNWFLSLPLYFEDSNFRAVHACWDIQYIERLNKVLIDKRISKNQIYESVLLGSDINNAIEIVLKGKELELPDGINFKDKYNKTRKDIRIKWWENPDEITFKKISIENIESLPDEKISLDHNLNGFYRENEKIVFFGHYWLKEKPNPLKKNVCCLDYSVADNGYLVAYRYSGEFELRNDNFIYV